jgi:predicted Zn-dependent protease
MTAIASMITFALKKLLGAAKKFVPTRPPAVLGGALALLLTGCVGETTSLLNPTPPIRPPILAAADNVSDREHRELVDSFGGEYRAPQMQAILSRIVARLVPATDRPEENYRVTILDSPAVNAFALPSGRLYVTRGLLALANDSSEIAAVMAHEIAHVTLRHAATRSELEMRSALVSRVVADVLRDQRAVASVRDASRVDIARFSREQELEADAESVRTLAKAGYDPFGAMRFLQSLDRWVSLTTNAADSAVQQAGYDMLATHPATPQRIEATRAAARRIAAPGIGGDDRDSYLAAVDGIAFGDNSDDGIVRGRDYVHGRLRIGFTAPSGFQLDNTSRAVLGTSSDGARRILFDTVDVSEGQDLTDVLMSTWTDAITTDSVTTLTVNGLPTATAASRGREWNFRIAALRHDDRVYRLIFAFRPSDAAAERLFQETLSSIRRVTADDVARMQPPRVRIVRATSADDVAGMSRRMTGASRSVAVFRVINGLDASDQLQPGRSYKIVSD